MTTSVLLSVLIGFTSTAAGLLAWLAHRRVVDRLSADCRQARADLDCITDVLSSGLLIVDRKGRVQMCNPAALKILGLRDVAPVGRSINDILRAGHIEFTRCIAHVLSGGENVYRREIEVQLAGVRTPVGVSVNRIGESDEEVGAVAIFQDLSEVIRMREQIREADRLAAVGQLSASIAHEIRNPLGSIRGSAEMLASELDLDGTDAKLMRLILKESRRVNTIITNFLAYARQPQMNPSLITVREFLEDMALQIKVDPERETEVSVGVDVFPDDMLLYADEAQLKQVILNLAVNAVEAADRRVRVDLQAQLDLPGKRAVLRVSDDGPGVPLEERDRIFEPFHTLKPEGTGLGLPIVKRIVLAHGGTVHVADDPRRGAVFEICLPLTRHAVDGLAIGGEAVPLEVPAVPGD